MKIVLAMAVGALSLWGGEYWIQVASIDQNSSADTAFTKRLEKAGYQLEVVYEGGLKKLLLGSYESEKAARLLVPEVRCRFGSDAFVRRYQPERNKVHTLEIEEIVQTAAVVETPVPEAKEECICLCSKSGRRQHELSQIMAFYKNSPDYTFER